MHMLNAPKHAATALVPALLLPVAAWWALSASREAPEPMPQSQSVARASTSSATPPALRAASADDRALLRRFALNALLAPLLDADTAPLRWADPALIPGCGEATDVRVDGVPLVVGTAVPTRPFTLSWVLVDCMPFGNASMSLSGVATLQVEAVEHGARALVQAERLRIDGVPAGADLAQPFTAFLAFAPAGTDPL